MREIKFRAWDGQKYYYFNNHRYDLLYNDISGWNVLPNIPNYKGEWLAGNSQDKTPDFMLEQFTGLTDKNGKEIYEGDVVYLAGYGYYKVEFPFTELYEAYLEGDIGEIKGNIHENPELSSL